MGALKAYLQDSAALDTLAQFSFVSAGPPGLEQRQLLHPAAAAPSVVAQVLAAAERPNRTSVRLTQSSKLWNSGKTKFYLVQ